MKNDKEAIRLIQISQALTGLGLYALKLKQLGMSIQASSFINVGIDKIASELEKMSVDFEFNRIMKDI